MHTTTLWADNGHNKIRKSDFSKPCEFCKIFKSIDIELSVTTNEQSRAAAITAHRRRKCWNSVDTDNQTKAISLDRVRSTWDRSTLPFYEIVPLIIINYLNFIIVPRHIFKFWSEKLKENLIISLLMRENDKNLEATHYRRRHRRSGQIPIWSWRHLHF